MQITHLPQRLEITFWETAVFLMNRKTLLTLPFVAVLSLALALALSTLPATRQPLYPLPPAAQPPVPDAVAGALAAHPDLGLPRATPTAPRTLQTGQQNTLVIYVDQVNAERPRLEGVWLVLNLPRSPRITLLPLYPASLQGGPEADEALQKAFAVDADGEPVEAFFAALSENDLWWDQWVMVDQTGVADMINSVGGVNLRGEQYDGAAAVVNLPNARTNPLAASLGQAEVLISLCQRGSHSPNPVSDPPAWARLSKHLRTDMSTEKLVTAWEGLQSLGYGLTCEFPTLNEALPTPVSPQ